VGCGANRVQTLSQLPHADGGGGGGDGGGVVEVAPVDMGSRGWLRQRETGGRVDASRRTKCSPSRQGRFRFTGHSVDGQRRRCMLFLAGPSGAEFET